MRNVKKINILAYLVLLYPVCCLPLACCHGSVAEDEESRAMVSLYIDSRAGEGGVDPNATAEEGIKTLRIVVCNANGDVVCNEKRDFRQETAPVLRKEIKIYDLPVGRLSFFLVANEESLDVVYADQKFKKSFVDVAGGGKRFLFVDEGGFQFPKRDIDIQREGLPLGGELRDVELRQGMQALKIKMIRAVAKLNITVENALTEDIVLATFQLGPFICDRMYLFASPDHDIPDDAAYIEGMIGPEGGMRIAPGRTGTAVFYVYPSAAPLDDGETPYKLGLNMANGRVYLPKPFVGRDGAVLKRIARNTQVNITARVSARTNVFVSFAVTSWKSKSFEVPPFE